MTTCLTFLSVSGVVTGGDGTIVVVAALETFVFALSGLMTALAPCPIASTQEAVTVTRSGPPVTSERSDVGVERRITSGPSGASGPGAGLRHRSSRDLGHGPETTCVHAARAK